AVDWRKSRLDWAVKDRSVVWNSASLGANLSAVLSRRVMDGLRAGCERLPLAFAHGASLDSIACFLAGEADEKRLEALLWGLMLVDQTIFDWCRMLLDHASLLPLDTGSLQLLFPPFMLLQLA